MANKKEQQQFEKVLEKISNLKKQEKFDLSSDEDLSIAVMNLVSIEEHFFFTGSKTENPKYFDLLNEVREIRKELMRELVKEPEGEVWCISKHLLAASMRIMEVGTKALSTGKKDKAKELFNKSFELYSLFWGLNLKAIDAKNISKIDDKALNLHDTNKKGLLGKLGDLVKKAIDCCIE